MRIGIEDVSCEDGWYLDDDVEMRFWNGDNLSIKLNYIKKYKSNINNINNNMNEEAE